MSRVTRRDTLKLLAAGAATAVGCDQTDGAAKAPVALATSSGSTAEGPDIVSVDKLGFPWRTLDPFLACMHHEDAYPAGNEEMGPAATLEGRRLGRDFGGKDGWSMYHGRTVPGFPKHPHRGFETVSVVRKGLLDHADSLGAAARYGNGDVQWLTAGKGIQHAEMFPLLSRSDGNPVEMFQIWLNLPKSHKMSEPFFRMFWQADIPRRAFADDAGRSTRVSVVAGALGDQSALAPPPSSWAAQPGSDVAIWTIALDANASWTLPRAAAGLNRALYFHIGRDMTIAGRPVPENRRVVVRSDRELRIVNGDVPSELLLLQGRPIAEPVARQGPFVMNTDAEIGQAYADYRRTEFGGWPWEGSDPVHGKDGQRFARYPDGKVEKPT